MVRRTLAIVALAAAPLLVVSTVQAAGTLTDPAQVRRTADRTGRRVDVAPPAAERIGREVLDIVNAARASRGLGPLAWDGRVAQAAQEHSFDMAARDRLSHVGSDGSSVGDRLRRVGLDLSSYGETVAAGRRDPRAAVDAWIASPAHAAILFGDHTIAAAGMATSASGTNYWTLVAGR